MRVLVLSPCLHYCDSLVQSAAWQWRKRQIPATNAHSLALFDPRQSIPVFLLSSSLPPSFYTLRHALIGPYPPTPSSHWSIPPSTPSTLPYPPLIYSFLFFSFLFSFELRVVD